MCSFCWNFVDCKIKQSQLSSWEQGFWAWVWECKIWKSHFEFLILFLCRRSIEYVLAAIVMWVHWGLIMMFSIRIFSCRTAIKISQYQLIQLVSIIHSTPTHPHVNCQWGNSIIQSGYQLGRMLWESFNWYTHLSPRQGEERNF